MRIVIKRINADTDSIVFEADDWCFSMALVRRESESSIYLSQQQLNNLIKLIQTELTLKKVNQEMEIDNNFYINLNKSNEHESNES